MTYAGIIRRPHSRHIRKELLKRVGRMVGRVRLCPFCPVCTFRSELCSKSERSALPQSERGEPQRVLQLRARPAGAYWQRVRW